MPVKTILLHMTDDERNEARLALAAALSRRFQAFIDVVYMAAPADLPATIGIRGEAHADIAEATVIVQHKAAQAESETRRALKSCSYAWTVADGDHLEAMADRSITADLALLTIPDPEMSGSSLQHLHDRLPLVAPCPVLILPRDWTMADTPLRHPVIAWKPMREASVAVRAALPFLTAAENVTVMTIENNAPGDADAVKDVIVYLERHGIAAKHHVQPLQQYDVGEALLAGVRAVGGDSLVMGAYGHSRLRELVLGGATRSVLRLLDVPVLMAH
jgi:nucleotide-binding universal stress UspA family protein